MEDNKNTVILSIDEYKQLLSENAKYKTENEVLVNKQKEVVLEIEQNKVNPQTEKKVRKGFFPINE